MRFVIRTAVGPFPEPPLGNRGSELAGYVPQGVEWKQLNYGQGEGQVEIAGCELGIYQTDNDRELAVVLHVGEFPAVSALDLVQRIAKSTCGNDPFDIVLQGIDEP